MNTGQDPRGRILEIKKLLDGTSRVKLDNGPFSTITIHTHTEDLETLLTQDFTKLRVHLMTRGPGHFRKKQRS
jgi:hypothetical protein